MNTTDFDFDAAFRRRGLARHFALRGDLHDVADAMLKLRVLEAHAPGARVFPVYREVRFAVRRTRDDVFDNLALHSGLLAQRLDSSLLILDGGQVFVRATARQKTGYTSGTLEIWATNPEELETSRQLLLGLAGDQPVREELFTIDWHFTSRGQGLTSVAFDEFADGDPVDEAYPDLTGGVNCFIQRFIAAQETVLILQGPPGTRLVRAILAALSRRKGDAARVLYTSDKRTLETDEIFIEFLTGEHDAFVVEDADHLLGARHSGNVDLHRFLTVADGVVRAQGRKIIFTTNLPNVGDIDEALVRPGRCFGVLRMRPLAVDEALRLIARLVPAKGAAAAVTLALPTGAKFMTLAEVFSSIRGAKQRTEQGG
jgi:hypothetical protein